MYSKSLFLVKKIKDNGTQKAVQRQRMGILLCEQNFRDVWIRNKSVRAEIGQILHTHTHTTAAKLVVRISLIGMILFKSIHECTMQPVTLYMTFSLYLSHNSFDVICSIAEHKSKLLYGNYIHLCQTVIFITI